MILSKGKHVRCYLKIGTVVEGIIEEWSEQQALLKSLNKQSLFLIARPNEDIVLTEIIFPEREASDTQVAIKEKLQEIREPTEGAEINKSDVQQLKKLLVEQEKKIIFDKVKEHSISEAKNRKYEDKYELPGFFKKPRTQ